MRWVLYIPQLIVRRGQVYTQYSKIPPKTMHLSFQRDGIWSSPIEGWVWSSGHLLGVRLSWWTWPIRSLEQISQSGIAVLAVGPHTGNLHYWSDSLDILKGDTLTRAGTRSTWPTSLHSIIDSHTWGLNSKSRPLLYGLVRYQWSSNFNNRDLTVRNRREILGIDLKPWWMRLATVAMAMRQHFLTDLGRNAGTSRSR